MEDIQYPIGYLVVTYAACYIEIDSDKKLKLKLGSDDGYKIWLNNKFIGGLHKHRGTKIDENAHEVELKKGINILFLKIEQSGGGYSFCLRFTDMEDKPFTDYKIHLVHPEHRALNYIKEPDKINIINGDIAGYISWQDMYDIPILPGVLKADLQLASISKTEAYIIVELLDDKNKNVFASKEVMVALSPEKAVYYPVEIQIPAPGDYSISIKVKSKDGKVTGNPKKIIRVEDPKRIFKEFSGLKSEIAQSKENNYIKEQKLEKIQKMVFEKETILNRIKDKYFEAGKKIKITESEEKVIIENKYLALTINKKEKGAIEQIVNYLTSNNILSDELKGRDLYRIHLVKKDKKSDIISSQDAKDSKVTVKEEKDQVVITITNTRHKDYPINVIAKCIVKPDSKFICWRAKIENKADVWIKEFHFPIAVCSKQLGETEKDDYIMYPYCDGQLISDPINNTEVGWDAGRGDNVFNEYPGQLSVQLQSYQDDNGGLYYATHDEEGHMKKMGPYHGKQGIELIAAHLPSYEFGVDYTTPYDTVLGVVKGDWYHTADMYKEWAVKQFWCKKKIIERNDFAKWLLDGTPVYAVYGHINRGITDNFSTQLINMSKKFREITGNNKIVYIMAGWEKAGPWKSPHYFPPRFTSETDWKDGMKALHNEDDISGVYLSGLKWIIINKPVLSKEDIEKYEMSELFPPEVISNAVIAENGKIDIRNSGGGYGTEICMGTDYAYTFLSNIIKECYEYGIDVAHLDIILGGGQWPCYAANHKHKPGPGIYQSRSFNEICSKLLKEGFGRTQNYAMSIEEPGELFLQNLTFYFSRERSMDGYPREGGLFVRGVPIFIYLYHEYIVAADIHFGNPSNTREAIFTHGYTLVSGMPANSTLDYREESLKKQQDVLKAIRNTVDMFKTPALKYLLKGKMLHPLKLNVPEKMLQFTENEIKKIKFPVILNSVFESPDGKGTGYVFFNWSEDKVTFDVPIDNLDIKAASYKIWQYGAGGNTKNPEIRETKLPISMQITLGSGEASFIEVVPVE